MISVPGWLVVAMAIVDVPGLLLVVSIVFDVIIQAKEEHDWRKRRGKDE